MQQPAPLDRALRRLQGQPETQDHQPDRARARSAEDPPGRRLRLHLERLRLELDAAREHGRVRAHPHRPAAARRHREGRPDGRNPRLEAIDADHRPADGQPRPRARVQGGRHRQGRACGRHADADVDAVESQHGGDRPAQSRAEVVPALRHEGPRRAARTAAAREGRGLHRDRADRRQPVRLSARGEHPQRVPAAALARQGQCAALDHRSGRRDRGARRPQARPQLGRSWNSSRRSPACR